MADIVWLDSHCHLDVFLDDGDFDGVVNRAQAAGVNHLVIPAVGMFNWHTIAQLCQRSNWYGAYGLHPIALDKHQWAHINLLEAFILAHGGVAIGECGLDYAIEADKKTQIEYFVAQLDVAQRLALPVIVHVRKSLDDVLYYLREFPDVAFIVHSFTGSDQQLDRLLDQGGYIGIGGTATYPRAKRLRRQLARIDENRYLLETDAPYQPINGFQGQRNEPARLIKVAQALAELREQSIDDIAKQSWQNSQTFFNLNTKYAINTQSH